jgi:hypothetical protein
MATGAVLVLNYTAGAYKVIVQGGGADVKLNANRRQAMWIKREDHNWYPMSMVPCAYVSAASGTSECVDQFNELINNLYAAGLML